MTRASSCAHRRVVTHEPQMARAIKRRPVGRDDALDRVASQLADVDAGRLGAASDIEQKMAAIGKELRKAGRQLRRPARRHLARRAALGRDPEDRTAVVGDIEDDTFVVPRAPRRRQHGGQRFGFAAVDFDPLELIAGEEADRPAVGRPEWRPLGALGARERSCLRDVQRTHEQLTPTRPVCHENNLASVGRQRERIRVPGVRRADLHTHFRWHGQRFERPASTRPQSSSHRSEP